MKRTLLSVFAVLMAATMMAAPRTVDDAQLIAKQFLSTSTTGLRLAAAPAELKLAHTVLQADQQPAFYVFNQGNDNGFVIVSADDNARQILGYANSGSFNEADMPENMRVWFQRLSEEMAVAAQQPDKAVRHSIVKRAYTPIEPLLGGIKWNQGSPYNDMCPIDQTDNKRSYTGCVATAAAQIMRYWKHPEQGVGSHTDNWDNSDLGGKGSGSETANFGATTYDWDNMLETYKSSATTAQKEAVATLMYHVGISCDMCYGSDKVGGSGAFTNDIARALYTYFKYDKGLRYIKKDILGNAEFEKIFLEELAAGRPILMGGATTDNEGHEFVCDGVDKDGYFHINWGWGGTSDNYFALSALDPDKQGAGGAASGKGFSVDVEAVIGIQPDKGNPLAAPLVVVEQNNSGKLDYTLSPKATLKTTNVSFSTQYGYNYGPCAITNGKIAWAVYTPDSTFVKACGEKSYSLAIGGANYQKISFSGNFNGLEAGDYLMALAFQMPNSEEWTPIGFLGEGQFKALRATADSVYIDNVEPEPPTPPTPTGNLDLDVFYVQYDTSMKKGEWVLVAYNQASQEPWVQAYFTSGANNKISGTYDLAGNKAVLWPDANDDDNQIGSTSGTLKFRCEAVGTASSYATYNINLSFVGSDENEYTFIGSVSLQAIDANENEIDLKDAVEPEGIENVSDNSGKASLKVFRNGILIIETENATFDIRGAKLK